MGFSEKIKNFRQERLLSQEAFAKELGVLSQLLIVGKRGKHSQHIKLYAL